MHILSGPGFPLYFIAYICTHANIWTVSYGAYLDIAAVADIDYSVFATILGRIQVEKELAIFLDLLTLGRFKKF